MLKMRLELTDKVEVLVAEDGEKGCEIAAAKRPDLILMDLEMPLVDGWEATRRLRASPRRATSLSSACRPTRFLASARRRSRPDVKSSISSRWSLIGCWAKFASWSADGWCKLREGSVHGIRG